MKKVLIGHVAVDSGQLMICDPCYIDGQWKHEEFTDVRVYKHNTTGQTLQYMKDFPHYEEVIPAFGMNMNTLLKSGEWTQVEEAHQPEHGFSYNAACKAGLSKKGHGELHFDMGHSGAGVAFATTYGDGTYPVYALYDNKDVLQGVLVETL